MAEDKSFDGTFYRNFKGIWDGFFGKVLPLPDEVGHAIAAAMGGAWVGHDQLLKGLAVAPGESTSLWWRTRPKFSFSTEKGIKTQSEARALAVAGFVAAYAGLLLGTAIVAAYETYGARTLNMLRPLAREIEKQTGRSFAVYLERMLLDAGFNGEIFHKAMHLGRSVSDGKLYQRASRRPAGGW